ncbi:hypothetical protein D3C80_2176290 [compost metagenome]
MPGDPVRVFGAGHGGVATSQRQTGTNTGNTAYCCESVEVVDVGAEQVGGDRQQGAGQRQGAPGCAAHEWGDQQ